MTKTVNRVSYVIIIAVVVQGIFFPIDDYIFGIARIILLVGSIALTFYTERLMRKSK